MNSNLFSTLKQIIRTRSRAIAAKKWDTGDVVAIILMLLICFLSAAREVCCSHVETLLLFIVAGAHITIIILMLAGLYHVLRRIKQKLLK